MARKQMYRTIGPGALAALGLTVTWALLEIPAHAATKAEQCWSTHKSCVSRCKRVFETADRINACYHRCDSEVMGCLPNRSDSDSMVQTDKEGRPVKPGVVIPRVPATGILQTGPNLPTQRPPSTGTAAPN